MPVEIEHKYLIILSLFILLLTSCENLVTKAPKDTERLALHGKVKSLQEENKIAYFNSSGYLDSILYTGLNDQRTSKQMFERNENLFIQKIFFFNSSDSLTGVTINTYENKLIVGTWEISGKNKSNSTFEYDNNDSLISSYFYQNGKLFGHAIKTHEESNDLHLTNTLFYDSENQLTYKISSEISLDLLSVKFTTEYMNDKGLFSSNLHSMKIFFDPLGNIQMTESTNRNGKSYLFFEYELDSMNNWNVQKTLNEDSIINTTYRTIRYYNN